MDGQWALKVFRNHKFAVLGSGFLTFTRCKCPGFDDVDFFLRHFRKVCQLMKIEKFNTRNIWQIFTSFCNKPNGAGAKQIPCYIFPSRKKMIMAYKKEHFAFLNSHTCPSCHEKKTQILEKVKVRRERPVLFE